VVGEEVRLELIIEANPTDATPAFSRFFLNKNKKIKEGALSLNKALDSKPKKKVLRVQGNQQEEKSQSSIPSHRSKEGATLLDLAIGFVLFLGMGITGYFIKRKLQDFFETKMSELVSELLSDAFLFSYLFATAWILAPLMGYQ
ncbi:MAG: hypothetical protein NXH75_13110, partial [Halobacteriovoraceae bacterium]|nr:hypothetical protein [Halobacteriovoraceae bacterium]